MKATGAQCNRAPGLSLQSLHFPALCLTVTPMTDRYSEYRRLARDLGVDAVALVPGPNFVRRFNRSFHSHERPLVVLIPQAGAPDTGCRSLTTFPKTLTVVG